jgi:cytochrome c oxidase subunit IV
MNHTRTYWLTWLALLGITLSMIVIGTAPFPRSAMLVLVLCGMMVKAGLISANFMHLRYERAALVATVVVSAVFIIVFLYFLLSIDGLWIQRSAVR